MEETDSDEDRARRGLPASALPASAPPGTTYPTQPPRYLPRLKYICFRGELSGLEYIRI